MKCIQCEGAMTSQRESYDYGMCGLPVILDGVTVYRCSRCGAHELALPRIEELHRVIARDVIRKPTRLSPLEIRFLRKWLGHSGEDLAELMGVTPEQVSRWENGKRDMGAPADRLLRLLVATTEPRDDYSTEHWRELRAKSTAPRKLHVRPSKSGWRIGTAA
jgi:putative zinc finger/helix-turn-helix YgiT family protein